MIVIQQVVLTGRVCPQSQRVTHLELSGMDSTRSATSLRTLAMSQFGHIRGHGSPQKPLHLYSYNEVKTSRVKTIGSWSLESHIYPATARANIVSPAVSIAVDMRASVATRPVTGVVLTAPAALETNYNRVETTGFSAFVTAVLTMAAPTTMTAISHNSHRHLSFASFQEIE